jgi:hypothetical protein
MSSFVVIAFALLGIERLLYGFIFFFPQSFKSLCEKGFLKPLLQKDGGLFWKVAKDLGMYIKVFQFGVVAYDLVINKGMQPTSGLCPLGLGLLFFCAGQALNVAVFNAIGGKGVYYGYELGYKVDWCDGFPYNLGFNDPQYWGVVLCIWGIYFFFAPSLNILDSHFTVPWLEAFWYAVSMKVFEHRSRGGAILQKLGVRPEVQVS